jgi:hypothetical protein
LANRSGVFGVEQQCSNSLIELLQRLLLQRRVFSVSLRKPVSIRISFLPAVAGPTFGLFQAAARSPIC